MNETQKNIKRYRAALPGLRERIMASLMLLMVSLSMMVSATFAWYTISVSPEVSAVATTVASNGNLEIALAHGEVTDDLMDREKPEEVALGDSSATQGQTLAGANITWGNLVNLSPDIYGMSKISLRPATLTDNNQSRTPLKGVDYTIDGRFIESDDFYRFATYDKTYGTNGGFRAGEGNVQYGVRAISSMILSNDEEQSEINEMGIIADEKFSEAKKAYDDIAKGNAKTRNGESCMDALVELLEAFVNDKASDVASKSSTVQQYVGSASYVPKDYGPMITDLQDLLIAFQGVLEKETEAIRSIANMYMFNSTGQKDYFSKAEDLRAYGETTAGQKELQNLGIPKSLVDVLKAHVSDYHAIAKTTTEIQLLVDKAEDGNKIYWDKDYLLYEKGEEEAANAVDEDFLAYYITNLVDINNTFVGPIKQDNGSTKFVAATKLSGLSDAQALLKADPIEVEIRVGVLKNVEDRMGPVLAENSEKNDLAQRGKKVRITIDLDLKASNQTLLNLALSVLGIEDTYNAVVRTNSGRDGSPAKLTSEIGAAKRLVPEPKNMVSKDVYGFAIDLWVRTNAHDTILTLEGMTEYEEVRGTCTDLNGDTRELWTATGKILEERDGEMVEVEHIFDCYIINEPTYKLDENGEPVMNGDQPVMENVDHVYDALGHGIVGIRDEMISEEGGYSFAPKMVKVYKGFHGENRVWQEMIDGGYVTANSTTQGAGSCYVFYASPTEQPKILEMLQSFTIAFLDGEDNLVATAKLNTAEAFAASGKVTVPLVVITGVAYDEQVADSEEIVSKKGIMEMPWGEATWLTAIVYLDGKEIGNDNVLAAGSIEGSLNLQFGSSVDINSQKNEPLLQKSRTITAVLKGNGAEDNGTTKDPAIEFAYDKTKKTVTAELTITGDQPNNVTAFLTRVVGKDQGSRMETKTFQQVGTTNKWTAVFELENPGEYRLNSVVADGVEYTLEKKPGAKITGQSTSEIICTPGSGSVMTSAEYYDIQLEMNISTTVADLQPDSVSVMFSYGNGKTAVANMSPIGNGNWRGKLHVTESGNYIMTYLVMDGNEDEVAQETSIFVRVGLEADVDCSGILGPDGSQMENLSRDPGLVSIQYQQPEEGETYTAKMQVNLYDGSGAQIKAMTGLKMVYALDSNPDHKIDGDLIWVNSADGGYYQVEMPFYEAGTYEFNSIVTDDEGTIGSITKASEAVMFSAVPPEPPVLTEAPNKTPTYQFKPDANTATMSVAVYDAESAVVEAEIVNLVTGVSTWVTKPVHDSVKLSEGDHRTIDTFTFTIPTNGDVGGKSNTVDGQTVTYVDGCANTQDGIWVLKNLRMQNVTNEEKELLPVDPDGEYLIFNMDSHNVRTEVMQTVYYSFTNQQGNEYKSPDVTGGILESHAFTGVTFKISDWRGSVEHINNVKLEVTHGGDFGDKGGYQYSGTVAAQNWLENGTKATYALSSLNLRIAGTYSVKLSYDVVVDGTVASSVKSSATNLTFTIRSKVPTVEISGTSQAAGTSVNVDKNDNAGDNNEPEGVTVPASTKTEATVYISYSRSGSGSTCDPYSVSYGAAPTVTITLSGTNKEGLSTATTVLSFTSNASDVHIYGDTEGNYTWNGDGGVTRKIGYVAANSKSKTAAKDLTASNLQVIRDGFTVTFALEPNIVIHNPY